METTKVEYQEFTWQAIKALANKVGVPFYASSTYRHNKGVGITNERWEKNRIVVEGYLDTHSDNHFTNSKVLALSTEHFLLKFELYCLKNNIEYVYTPYAPAPANVFGGTPAYIQFIKKGN